MFYGDRGQPGRFVNERKNFNVIIDNEKMTVFKLSRKLGFYNIINMGKIKQTEIYYDTDKLLFTGAGLLLRKKITPKRTYFSLVRISTLKNIENREKKSFLGECDRNDQPSDFPDQIADGINRIFANLFTINISDIVKHCTPYIRTEITGNKYKIVSGTGYEVIMTFEDFKIKNMRTGHKAKTRNFSLEFPNNPAYEHEKQYILETIDKYCKEVFYVKRNRFEIAEVLVKDRVIEEDENGNQKPQEKPKKKTRKELKEERKAQEEKN